MRQVLGLDRSSSDKCGIKARDFLCSVDWRINRHAVVVVLLVRRGSVIYDSRQVFGHKRRKFATWSRKFDAKTAFPKQNGVRQLVGSTNLAEGRSMAIVDFSSSNQQHRNNANISAMRCQKSRLWSSRPRHKKPCEYTTICSKPRENNALGGETLLQ
jgi:hypothetical protein